MPDSQVAFSEISPSEFFYRNRDLAGFSNPARALYSAVRELVENSLDACEAFSIHPDIYVRITTPEASPTRTDSNHYLLKVLDNGPGVDAKHIPKAFGRVFFGSKYELKQARGMFGLGGTMAILYGQITTNKPVIIRSSTDGKTLEVIHMMIDIQSNSPVILKRESLPANGSTGTSVEVMLEGDYSRSSLKIQEYFKQTALVNPYANLTLVDPQGKLSFYERATQQLPTPPRETLPHPHGIDVEALRRIIKKSKDLNMLKFLCRNFHRVGDKIARKFLDFAKINPDMSPNQLSNEDIVTMTDALHSFEEFLQPDGRCLSPIGEEILKTGIMKELDPEFVVVATRPPAAYSGFPFIVEVGLVYGSKQLGQGLELLRFANRIPLLYDEGNDVSWKVMNNEIDWKRYKIPQDAPLAIITHVCSTKIPYKTVGKEYLADRIEVEREIKNAIREVLRKVYTYLSHKGSLEMVKRKTNIYSHFLPLIAKFSQELAGADILPRYKKLLESRVAKDPETNTPEERQTEPDSKPLEKEEHTDEKPILRFYKEGQLTLEEFADE